MRKTITLVVAGIVAGIAFVTVLQHSAAGAGAKKLDIVPITDSATLGKYARMGWVVRTSSYCVNNGAITTSAQTCLVLQEP